jgi:hypothetical protein
MKACAIVGGGFIVLIAAIALDSRIAHMAGVSLFGPMACVLAGMAAWKGHTSESLAIAEDAFDAMRDAGIKQDAAAALVGITPSQLSAQKVGRERLNLSGLLAALGPEYRVAYHTRALKREGINVEHASLAEMVRSELQMFFGSYNNKAKVAS